MSEMMSTLRHRSDKRASGKSRRPDLSVRGAAVITGAGSGIGQALAYEFAGAGRPLALLDIDEDSLARTAARCGEIGADVGCHTLDVADPDALDAAAAAIHERFQTIGIVCNVAGIIHTGNLLDSELADIHRVMDVDFWGIVHGTKVFLPYLIASGDGYLVNVSSAFGLVAAPGYSAYNAAKFAVRGFTESVQQEMLDAGHPVQISCVYPGGIRTAIMRNSTWATGYDGPALQRTFDQSVARMSAEDAATRILRGVAAGKSRILVGADAAISDALSRITGTGYQRIARTAKVIHRRRAGRTTYGGGS